MAMTYDIWMKETAIFGKFRSDELKEIDKAVKDYYSDDESNKFGKRKKLQDALKKWQTIKDKEKGGWRNSDRNKKSKAVERLDADINSVIKYKILDQKEINAQREIEKANRENLAQLFANRKLTVKRTGVIKDINTVRSSAKKLKDEANLIRRGPVSAVAKQNSSAVKTEITNLMKSLFDANDLSEATEALGLGFCAEIIADLIPVLGMLKSGVGAAVKWGGVAKQAYKKHKTMQVAGAFAPGDPAAAFEAIISIMNREIINSSIKATTETIAFAAQLGTTLADGGAASGPIIGACKTAANLINDIYYFARDWKEMKAANNALAQSDLSLDLFNVNPLLGCYLISCSDTSVIINMAVSRYGNIGWKFEVEKMVKQAAPVMEYAKNVIDKSRFEIPELRGNKGVVKSSKGITNQPGSLAQKAGNFVN